MTRAAVKRANEAERAVQAIGDVGAASAASNVVQLAAATERSAAQMQRDLNKIVATADGLSKALDRRISVFGKSADEIRDMRIEMAALAAEEAGETARADDLRAKQAQLYDMKFAAARKAEQAAQAAAEEEAAAAAASAEAARLDAYARDQAANAYQMFMARVREGAAAMREQAAAEQAARVSAESYAASLERQVAAIGVTAAELKQLEIAERAAAAATSGNIDLSNRITGAGAAIAAAEQEAAAQRDAARAHDAFEAAAARGMATLRQEEAATASMAAAVERLRGRIDPAYAAQQRFNAGVSEARAMVSAGAISLDEYCAALRVEQAALDGAVGGADHLAGAHGRASNATLLLQHSVRSAADSFAAGLPPSMIFAEQIGRVGEAAALSGGSLGKFGAIMSGPWGIALTAGVSLLAVFIPKLLGSGDAADEAGSAHKRHAAAVRDDADAIDALNKATGALNRTHAQEVGNALAAARAEYAATLAIRDQTKASLERAIAAARATDTTVGVGGVAGTSSMISGMAASKVRDLSVALADATKKADATGKALDTAFRGAVSGEIQRRVEAGFDASAAAVQRYSDRVRELDQRFAAGKITGAQLRDAIRDETIARDKVTEAAQREREAAKSNTDAKRDAAKVAREQAKDERELESALAAVTAALDPAAASWDAYQKQLAEISRLEAAGKLDGVTAAAYRQKAAIAELEKEQATAAAEAKAQYDAIFGADYSIDKWTSAKLSTDGMAKSIEAMLDPSLKVRATVGDIGSEARGLVGVIGGDLGRALSSLLGPLEKLVTGFAQMSTLAKAVAGAGIGSALAGVTGGNALAGAAGGALGSYGGSALASSLAKSGITDLLGPGLQKALGAALPVVGSIAGGLLGSLIGGLFKKVKQAGATIEVIAGSAVTSSITGNSAKLKALAGTMADSVIKSLDQIVDQLGGQLSDAATGVTIGQYNGKYRVNTLGTKLGGSSKPVAGLTDFGDDQAAAVAYAVSAMIQKGAITGLSAAEQTLLQGKGDLQTQLQKVLSFQSVFDELKQKTDPVGYAMDQIAKKFDGLTKIFAEAGASADDYAKLAQLRTIEEQEAQQQAAQAVQDNSERLGLERQLLEAQGDTAALRKLDLDALLPANRALQEQIWAVQDATAAQEVATQAADAAAQAEAALASQRSALEDQINQLTGDTAAIRAKELAALDESLRPLQQRIYDLTDEKAASDAAAQAAQAAQQAEEALTQQRLGLEGQLLQLQGDTAEIRRRELAALDATLRPLQQRIYDLQDEQAAAQAAAQAAEAAAQAEQALAATRSGLEDQILQLTGDTTAIRAKELASLDASLRPLQERIYALQDEQAATEAATQAAQAAAQAQEAIEDERKGLMQQLYEATGDTAALRAMQLDALDPSNRALQQQIWAIQDAKAAADAAQQLADAWTSIGDTIMAEVKRIRGLTDAGGGNSFVALQGQFNAAIAAARAGDQAEAKGLPDLSKSLLDAAAAAATSRQELARIEAQTAAQLEGVYGVIQAATGMSDAATSGFGSSSGSSTSDASAWWSTFAAAAGGSTSADSGDVLAELRSLRAQVASMQQDNNAGHAATAGNTGRIDRKLDAVTAESGGDAISVMAVAA